MEILDKDFLVKFFYLGFKEVEKYKEEINALNVFPVPDGDTGTNMYMTLLSAWEEINKEEINTTDDLISAIVKGSLMGARGNSGVILSQIFKGMGEFLKNKDKITGREFALSFVEGVNRAYKAVIKPVEGTILTVSKSFSVSLYERVKEGESLHSAFLHAIKIARDTLRRTPDMLSVLKEAGVVDAGGFGFLKFVEGGYRAFGREEIEMEKIETKKEVAGERILKYPFDTVLLVRSDSLTEELIKKDFNIEGDSLIVGKERDLIKIHFHTKKPTDVIEFFMDRGEIVKINVENMQYEVDELQRKKGKEIGIVAVSRGKGFEKMLKELGVDVIIEGGQTFNPSTKDLVEAIEKVNAKKIIVFPNNSNVIFSALQAKELTNKEVEVIPTKSIPQCISVVSNLNPNSSFEDNVQEMIEVAKEVKTIEVTKAVRSSIFNGKEIKAGEYIAIFESKDVRTGKDPEEAALSLLLNLDIKSGTLITIYYGEEIDENRAEKFKEIVQEKFPESDVEVYEGGQPLYPYIISLE